MGKHETRCIVIIMLYMRVTNYGSVAQNHAEGYSW